MNALVRPPYHSNPALYTSPEMILELALGAEPDLDIAAKYGITAAEFGQLQTYEWFVQMVVERRMDLAQQGLLFEHQAGMMAEEIYKKLYQQAITGTLAHTLMLETAKAMREIAKPKQAAGAVGPGGPAFQINIQVNGVDAAAAKGRRFDDTVAKPTVPVISIPMGQVQTIPPKPEPLRVPDFDLRVGALVGTPNAVAAAQAPLAMPPQPR